MQRSGLQARLLEKCYATRMSLFVEGATVWHLGEANFEWRLWSWGLIPLLTVSIHKRIVEP
jgi:hypothetical protein